MYDEYEDKLIKSNLERRNALIEQILSKDKQSLEAMDIANRLMDSIDDTILKKSKIQVEMDKNSNDEVIKETVIQLLIEAKKQKTVSRNLNVDIPYNEKINEEEYADVPRKLSLDEFIEKE